MVILRVNFQNILLEEASPTEALQIGGQIHEHGPEPEVFIPFKPLPAFEPDNEPDDYENDVKVR